MCNILLLYCCILNEFILQVEIIFLVIAKLEVLTFGLLNTVAQYEFIQFKFGYVVDTPFGYKQMALLCSNGDC